MCGIFLLANSERISEDFKNKSQKAIKLLEHRGPDYSNIFFTEKIAIGHTRLSILDLNDRSNQPFYDKNTDCYLAINGEIINYKELAKKYSIDLESAGSDCKLVFQLFNRYGVRKIINEMEGMFSGIYVDKKKNISIIFRDRFGIKPIYYYITNDYFVAASEINAILPFIDKPSQEINIVRDFIIDGNIDHSNKTFFANIFQLSSGNLMEIDNFRIK